MSRAPELLSPAGSLKHVAYALAYGADAVYAGQPRYSLRTRNNAFRDPEALGEGIARAHARGRRFFVASNIIAHDNKVRTYLRDMEAVIEQGPDALIMSDPGLILLVRERWPEVPIHLSVQASTSNSAAVRFWAGAGIRRVILSRELSLEEIARIREACPETELEVFVHGALCIAYSGRCLLSGYFNHRDPNQGACTNSCRWSYRTAPADEDETGQLQPVLLEEERRRGELMPMYEDEHGSYILNSRDLRAVQHVGELTRLGIDSLKIEGRTKSAYYTARTTQVYRSAIDAAVAGRAFEPGLLSALDGLSSRGYTEGFYRRHPPQAYQNYTEGSSGNASQRLVGEVIDACDHWLELEVKNRLAVGMEAELMTPAGNHRFRVEALEDPQGRRMEVAPGAGYRVRIPRPEGAAAEFALLLAATGR
ncbi:MAG: U32 family peptidase [Gammaproteobacteria bacterium]|nr:MAG: U32 family peptidase [Gammaproteobacteria bacterium]